MGIKELDYVLCKDGRKGTVVHIYINPSTAYELEFDGGKGQAETVEKEQIEKVITA